METTSYSGFVGSRVRFQRLSNQQVLAGWIQFLSPDRSIVAAEAPLEVEISERYLFQVQGPGADAYFLARSTCLPAEVGRTTDGSSALKLEAMPEFVYEFSPVSPFQFRRAQQQARKAIGRTIASIECDGRSRELLIVDASPDGIGVIALEDFKKGQEVCIIVTGQKGQVSLACEVRHRRPEPRLSGAFRVGLRFLDPDSRSREIWHELMARPRD